ncbi:MAG: mechanosensitive ion channel, partial [Erysipelotrichaceae bacterium]|nr:mechanosensitive ion channel [Erysipelotrichaceae bacterium]
MNWQELWQKILDNSQDIALKIIMIVLIFLVANLIIKVISHFTGRTIQKASDLADRERGKQITTLMTVTRSVSRYIIYFLAILFVLEQIGFGSSLSNLLVTAGVGSLIISLGAQTIINDFLAGMFILFEKQYSVGDYVKIGDYSGTVTSVAMRVTYLRNYEGQKIIIPNGQITSVINYGAAYNLAKLVVPTPYGADSRHMIEVIQET